MKVKLIRIGNSQGIRIPKSMIEQCELTEEVDLTCQENALIIKPVKKDRDGWAEEFKSMHQKGDDAKPDDFGNVWDEEEWEW